MKVFKTIQNIQKWIYEQRLSGASIGFVPTMGALHQGHLSLLQRAKNENSIVACSIFVNPTQFNNPHDLEKYPRQMDHDIKLLESVECDVLFSPEVEEMYPQGEAVTTMDFGILETVMEGKDRPGHFNGVGIIVKKLFEIILPDKAYFGKKDYQQLAIIRLLTKQFQLSPEIIGCDIVRESDGLAMSSRNQRLSAEERSLAPAIYQILTQAVSMQYSVGVPEIRAWVKQQINANPLFDLVYFEIADSQTLETIHQWDKNQKSHAFIVVNVGDVRLIDNLPFDK